MAQKMAQGLVDRQRLLLGPRQAIDILQDVQFEIAQLEIQFTAAAQLQAEQQ
jgi:hypothetical protein